MSQNRKKNNSGSRGPFGGGGQPPGNFNGRRRSEAEEKARNVSTIIAVIMLVAIVVPVLISACFYQNAGGASYDWPKVSAAPASPLLSYSSSRYLKRDFAESVPTASLPAPQTPLGSNQFYVGETGHFVSNSFLKYWQSKGGTKLFGNPLSEEFELNGHIVQLFERAFFEYHPEAKNTSSEVQLGLLGKQLAEARGLFFSPGNVPTTTSPTVIFFSQTSHSIAGALKVFWENNGGVAMLGYPISEELNEEGKVVQYFERGRLELNREGDSFKAAFSPAGQMLIAAKSWPRPTIVQVAFDIDGNEIWQGRTLSIDLTSNGWSLQKLQGNVGKDPLHFGAVGAGFKAFEAFAPNLDPSTYPLNIQFNDPAGRLRNLKSTIQVTRFDFSLQRLDIPDNKTDLLNASADEADNKILGPIYSIFTSQILWSGKWGWPTTGQITTEFGEGRIYNDRPLDPNYYHAGLDIAQNEGAAVYAPASGKVVFVGALQVHGNAVGIDHGLGVLSFYYHLASSTVKVGQQVKSGDVLGRVGTTGRSNGPHLHWEVRVNGVPTDPRTFQKLDLSN